MVAPSFGRLNYSHSDLITVCATENAENVCIVSQNNSRLKKTVIEGNYKHNPSILSRNLNLTATLFI